jgi:hypothetical protein
MLTLRREDTGRLVYYMQSRLLRLGEKGDGLVADGYFGPITEGAVKDMQVRWDLVPDGIVGPRTWQGLLQTGGELVGGDKAVKAAMMDMVYERLEAAQASDPAWALVEVAWESIGGQEKPWGSNKGGDIATIVQGTKVTGISKLKASAYKEHWGITQTWLFPPWCAIAVSSWMAEAFDATSWSEIPFRNWFGGVTQTVKWADKQGLWREVGNGDVRPGELFVMGRMGSGSDEREGLPTHAGHIGIVAWDDGDHVVTIEGNCGNAVRSKRRAKSDLIGFVNWEGAK